LEPGEYVDLTGDQVNEVPHAEMIYDGRLIEVDEQLVKQAQRTQREEEKVQQEAAEAATEAANNEEQGEEVK
jgi:hypothetical protein